MEPSVSLRLFKPCRESYQLLIFVVLSQYDVLLYMYDDALQCMCCRERANLQLVNRRLERKVKEMMMQVEEEHHSMQDQKDQVRKILSHVHNNTHSVQKLNGIIKPYIRLLSVFVVCF